MPPSPDAYWLALRRVRGVGPRTARLLLERFGSAEAIFAAGETALAAAGIPRPTARAIHAFDDFAPLEMELCELPRIGARLVRWPDPDYPLNLKQIADPPPYFFIRGQFDAANPRCVAVVGARAASDVGRRMARRLGFELAAKGYIVASGLARGIDAEAHQGALDAGGQTVALMGCGIDVIYPPENRKLADAIIDGHGGLISELPVGTPPIAENFPGRNRLIAGLALGVVVVEAAEKSGSLITARMALEQDRQVFAVPGSPLTGRSRGSNRLLKDGARLVDCVEDVIEELAPQLDGSAVAAVKPAPRDDGKGLRTRAPIAADSEPDEVKMILNTLQDAEKLHIDSIIENSGLNARIVLNLLTDLELRGLVTQYPGKLFSLA
jgi:DNA processing protein